MDWIMSKLAGAVAPKYIGSLVRTLIIALGGALLSLGIPVEQVEQLKVALEPVASGAITIGVGLLWSLIQKKTSAKQLWLQSHISMKLRQDGY